MTSTSSLLRYILFHHQTTTLTVFLSMVVCCVISSFITKPQLDLSAICRSNVALYPLSSPNHNVRHKVLLTLELRYILFHHQTTTLQSGRCSLESCVISSFITKPQLDLSANCRSNVALYPLSSPNHNSQLIAWLVICVALYPLSSPNHNPNTCALRKGLVALYPLSSPNHNLYSLCAVILYSYKAYIVQEMEW